MLKISVLGPGCPNCQRVEALAKRAVANFGVQAEVEKITDYAEISTYPILSTPGLVINGNVVCSGRVPREEEVLTWVANALQAV